MSRLLSSFLILHWAAVFTLLSLLAIFGGEAGATSSLRFFGLAFADGELGVLPITTATGLSTTAFVFCAVLFWWAFVTSVGSFRARPEGLDEILTAAFTVATFAVTAIVAYGAVSGAEGLMPIMATHFAALISSYIAISTEREAAFSPSQKEQDELRLAARIRALDASTTAMLPRFDVRFDRFRTEPR